MSTVQVLSNTMYCECGTLLKLLCCCTKLLIFTRDKCGRS